jgi:hypothetical protein
VVQEEETVQAPTPLEDRIRMVDWSDDPDWIHMKAIQVSRLLDEDADQDTTNSYFLLQNLALIRRVYALESLLMDLKR